MFHETRTHRIAAGLVLGALALAAIAPAASAGQGRGNGAKWKRSGHVTRVVRHAHGPRIIIRERSHEGSALVGFVGGLILGTAVAHAEPVYAPPPPPRYDYYDPYCDLRFRSLDACARHFDRCRHPEVVQVIEIRTGRVADEYSYDHDHWRVYDGDRDGDHCDRRYYEDDH